MPLPKHKLIVFDLDGTLAPSKSPMEPDMAELVARLIRQRKVAVISGGAYPQFETQFLRSMPASTEGLNNLLLLPTSGTRMYAWRGTWAQQYAEQLTAAEKAKIMEALNFALKQTGFQPGQKIYGQIIEDRGSQITFSALGQEAPLELKSKWDPDRTKREKIIAIMQPKIPEFDIRMGGTTSIDVTRRGVNKGYGIRKLEEHLGIGPSDILFIGDALYPGGNDYPAKAAGVDCIQVSGPEETSTLIRNWLG